MRTASMICMAAMSSAVALVLLVGSGVAQVQSNGSNATGILNLAVGGTNYDVTFKYDTAENIYGAQPGTYDFTTLAAAILAVDAVNAALNAAGGIETVGPQTSLFYNVPFDFENDLVIARQGEHPGSVWIPGEDLRPFQASDPYADFAPAGTVPVESTTWGRIKALYGN